MIKYKLLLVGTLLLLAGLMAAAAYGGPGCGGATLRVASGATMLL